MDTKKHRDILIVDDDRDARELFSFVLEEAWANVAVAEDGEADCAQLRDVRAAGWMMDHERVDCSMAWKSSERHVPHRLRFGGAR